jgi:hypothetical protein
MSNHVLFWLIPHPGCQRRITLSLESFSTIPLQAGNSYVKIPKWGQHGSNCRMPCLVSIFGTFPGTGDQQTEKTGVHFWCGVDIFSSITNHEIQQPGMLLARTIGQVSPGECTNDRHNCCSSRKCILPIPPPVARLHLAVYLAIFRVCEAHRFKMEVHLTWEMCKTRCIHLKISL